VTIKTVFLNPGDTLVMKIIRDPELPKNNREWEHQVRPPSILMTVAGPDTLDFANPPVLRHVAVDGRIKRYLA